MAENWEEKKLYRCSLLVREHGGRRLRGREGVQHGGLNDFHPWPRILTIKIKMWFAASMAAHAHSTPLCSAEPGWISQGWLWSVERCSHNRNHFHRQEQTGAVDKCSQSINNHFHRQEQARLRSGGKVVAVVHSGCARCCCDSGVFGSNRCVHATDVCFAVMWSLLHPCAVWCPSLSVLRVMTYVLYITLRLPCTVCCVTVFCAMCHCAFDLCFTVTVLYAAVSPCACFMCTYCVTLCLCCVSLWFRAICTSDWQHVFDLCLLVSIFGALWKNVYGYIWLGG